MASLGGMAFLQPSGISAFCNNFNCGAKSLTRIRPKIISGFSRKGFTSIQCNFFWWTFIIVLIPSKSRHGIRIKKKWYPENVCTRWGFDLSQLSNTFCVKCLIRSLFSISWWISQIHCPDSSLHRHIKISQWKINSCRRICSFDSWVHALNKPYPVERQ